MEFRIADTFTDSLARLQAHEQKAAKTTAFDLQLDPARPGLKLHRLDRSKDPSFWSVRVNADIRIIVHRTESSLLLCYVGHHDDAYRWAERRKIERHPRTGAAQLVEVRERVEEVVVVRPLDGRAPTAPAAPLFAHLTDGDLLPFGVPEEWLADVRRVTEDGLFDLLAHLPQEAAEALLEIATGGMPAAPAPVPVGVDPFSHPDAQRRFRVLENLEELQRAVDYPWERWTLFLHPVQRQFVERRYGGPARVSGSAGTGKTVVALHRAAILARRNPDARVLLTTFSPTLAGALRAKLRRLVGNEPEVHKRITVRSIAEVGEEAHARLFGAATLAPPDLVASLLAAAGEGSGFGSGFLRAEWANVVDAWQVRSWEAYRNVPRLGRRVRVGGRQREALWSIFQVVRAGLAERGVVTAADMFGRVSGHLAAGGDALFDFAVVDEAQDMGIAELRFLARACPPGEDALFFTGDLGQRIFQQPFSWKALGIDVRGRSHMLRVNYRTSHQIRTQADRLLPRAIADVDGNEESRLGAISVFDGPAPVIRVCEDVEDETRVVADWLKARVADGARPEEIGLFVRSEAELERARRAAAEAGLASAELSDETEAPTGRLAIGTMHRAKGLEFKAVAVMACDDEVIPSQARIEAIADPSDLEDAYDTERHLLYVACTRARDHLLVTGVAPASEFLDDLRERAKAPAS